jgi:5,10-methylenetetrahydromethanopterin reductase
MTSTVGVISHLQNPTFGEVRALARAAEAAGADWLGLPDAFWWRDTWLLLAEAARATGRMEIGPLVTNPYLRHPFHTVAAIASLQDLAGPRVFVGLGAGGSEVTGAARIPRDDAPLRVQALADLLRTAADDQTLDRQSGRKLEVPYARPPIVIAGRADGILRTAGRAADRALLWAVPSSDLERSAAMIAAGWAEAVERPKPEVIWAPLVDHGGTSRQRVRTIAAYSVLNSRPSVHARWRVDHHTLQRIRDLLVAGGAAAAQSLVPSAALDDLIIPPEPSIAARITRAIGARSMAIPAFSIEEVDERVTWARHVLSDA